jgi:hypothetical protein
VTPIEDTLARLSQIRVEIERHATDIWLLEREAEELRHQVRLINAKAPAESREVFNAAS